MNSSVLSFLYVPILTSIHDHWKTIDLTKQTFVSKVMSLLFNILSRLVIAFLPRSKCLLISWLQSPSAVIFEPRKIKCDCFHCFSICHGMMGKDATILVFSMLSFKPPFHSPRRRQWHPTPVLLPGKSHGWRSLEGCSPWGR